MTSTTFEETGPIDYLVVEFPSGAEADGSALSELLALVDRGTIRVLDLAFIDKSADGTATIVDVNDIGLTGDLDVELFGEARSGVLDDEDLDETASVIEPGHLGAVLVYENTWAAPFASALRATGAQLVAGGRIPIQAMLASLEADVANS